MRKRTFLFPAWRPVSRAAGLRHLLGVPGVCQDSEKRGLSARVCEICDRPGAADCAGSSGDREISLRTSENDQRRPRGGFAPFTLISHDLSEFRENGPAWGVVEKYATPLIRVRLHWIFQKSRDFSGTDPCRPRGGFAPFTLISLGISGFVENGPSDSEPGHLPLRPIGPRRSDAARFS